MSSPSSRPHPPTPRRRTAAAVLGGALVVCAVSAAPAAARKHDPAVLDRVTPAGPAAEIAWTSGVQIRVSSPGAPERTVATMPKSDATAEVALSRDGRFLVAVGRDSSYLVRVADGGRPTYLGDGPSQGADGVRWAPDDRQVLFVFDGSPRRCVVLPTVSCRNADVGNAIAEYGASWSPDSTSFAFIRDRVNRRTGLTSGDLVTADASGLSKVRVIERARKSGTNRSFPAPPVWTRAGLVFTGFSTRGRDETVVRGRTRIVQADGRIHTLTAGRARLGRRASVPFLATSDSPSGLIAGTEFRQAGSADGGRLSAGVRTLDLQGRLGSYGVDYPIADAGFSQTLGILSDGRVALRVTRDSRPTSKLYLLAPGSDGLGRPVATGGSVDAAVAFPDETRGF